MKDAYKEAKRRVKRKKDFFKEVTSFVGTSGLLIFINVFTSPAYLWCLWAIVPWGITLAMKGLRIASMKNANDWEENEIRKELISMGKDPEDYMDDQLELREIEKEYRGSDSSRGYKKSDLV
ncbi:MAG: 2TM domain-containing protein [Saprospiraceae bacterium]|nr:2TM domain-containing protein [Saprospiraceae bacterium]